jgi:hypothetical protein
VEDLNLLSNPDPDRPLGVVVVLEPAGLVVVVLEPAGLVVVVVVPVLELEQPAARTATVVSNARPAAMRFGLKLVPSLIMLILRLVGSPTAGEGTMPERPLPGGRWKYGGMLAHLG